MSTSLLLYELEEFSQSGRHAADPRFRLLLISLLNHSGEHLRGKSDSATQFFRKATELLLKLRGSTNAALRLDFLLRGAEYLFFAGLVKESDSIGQHGLALATRTGQRIYIRRFCNILGITANETGDRGRSAELHSRALLLAIDQADAIGQYAAWSNLSAVFLDSGMYGECVACGARALTALDSRDPEYSDRCARVQTNSALAHFFLGNDEQALEYAKAAVNLTSRPDTQSSAIACLVRELNLVMILVGRKEYLEARRHSDHMSVVAASFPSIRASATADLAGGMTEVFLGDSIAGLEQLRSTAALLKGQMTPLYLDALAILMRVYADLNRPKDALQILRERLSSISEIVCETISSYLRSTDLWGQDSLWNKRNNRQYYEMKELELRASIAEDEVAKTRLEMLERMAVTADIREDISGEHGYRVGRLSALLAREIGWDRDACSSLDIAARLHDIGKIGIPEKILFDEKTLREAEKHFIAAHTKVGAEILARSEIPQVAIAEEIARCHHEWWDGNGYPRQLKGVSIPKSARIVALADVFDAMTHGRPYAKAVSVDAALDQIALLRGKQFDPELTDHFLGLVRRLAAMEKDLDAYLGKAARNSPFLKARARIKEILAQERESTDEVSPRASDTTLH